MADGAAQVQGVTVVGNGQASAVPDVLVAELAAHATSTSPAEAFSAASTAVRDVADAAGAEGVSPEDVRTGQITLRTDYDRDSRPQGFSAWLDLEVHLRDLPRAGDTLTRLVEAADRHAEVRGTRFEHSSMADLQRQARDAAFADARSRAEQYAQLAGRPLGPVLMVVEGEPGGMPRPMFARMASDAGGPPVEPGVRAVSVLVTVTWAWA